VEIAGKKRVKEYEFSGSMRCVRGVPVPGVS